MLREEQRVRLEPTWIKRALMDNVKQVEAMRSRLAVRKQRLHSALSEVTESGPCPTLKVANIPKRNYHDTHYHAEYLKPKLTSAVQPSLMSNVSNDAQNEERRRIDNEKLQRLKKQQDANLAAKRYNKAMQTVLMEKKENQIMKELKNFDKADRIRKQAFRFVVISGFSIFANTTGVYFFKENFDISFLASRIIVAVLIGVFFNFFMNRYFVFR